MYETYKIMSANLPKELQDKELEELCEMYSHYDVIVKGWVDRRNAWEEENRKLLEEAVKTGKVINLKSYEEIEPRKLIEKEEKIRNDIYRTMYCKLYPMMLTVQKNYTTLSNAQRVEVTMMILISTLRCYSQNKKIKTKFSTYYCNNLKNGMMTQINSLKCTKRSVWLNIIDDEQQNNFILASQQSRTANINEDFINNMEGSLKLSTPEKSYIKCMLQGYKKTEEICKQLNLGEKINKYNESRGITNPISSEKELRLVKRIKKSLKSKCKEYGIKLFS